MRSACRQGRSSLYAEWTRERARHERYRQPRGAALAAGDYLRLWRQRRRMSQLDFALEAEISQRHLSFMESGRATPSREMLMRLAERLDVPLRERNAMLLAGVMRRCSLSAPWTIRPWPPPARRSSWC